MNGQMSIMDFLIKEDPQEEPELQKGIIVYKLILDVIEEGIIDRFWKCEEGYGYSAKKPRGCYFSFWSPNVGETVFTSKLRAMEEAEKLRNTYKVIRAKDMGVIKEKNYIEAVDDSRQNITETVKLLKGNMIYFKRYPCYPFLEICKSEEVAEKRYKEALKEITQAHDTNKTGSIETDSVPALDMYLAGTGLWSDYEYTEFNHPVLMIPNNS